MKIVRNNLSLAKKARKSNTGSVRIWKLLLGWVVMMIFPVYLFPQACCSGGVTLGGSLGLGSDESRSIQFLLTYDYNLLNDLMNGTDLLQDDTRSLTTHAAMLVFFRGLLS